MPLVRYFVFTGGILLGLLFLADWYFPLEATASAYKDVDRSVIRIHTSHRWPDAINFDTSASVVTSAPIVADAAPVNAPAPRVRQAYAFQPPLPQKVAEKIHRRARSAPKPASREPVQHFANYDPSDRRNY